MIASTQTNHPLINVGSPKPSHGVMDQAFAKLKSAGLRITQPRVAIISVLLKRNHPSSIEQIHGDLADGSCDLVTVYRCLAAFEGIGLVRRSFFLNGTSLYELSVDGANRYHVVSKNTHEVQALDAESVAELQTTVQRIEERLREKGLTNVSHVVEFFADTAADPSRGQKPVKTS